MAAATPATSWRAGALASRPASCPQALSRTGRRTARKGAPRRTAPTAALKTGSGFKATWSQTTDEVHIRLPISDDVRGGDIEFEVHPKRLRLEVAGEAALAGYFEDDASEPLVDPDGCFWSIETDEEGVRAIMVTLEKKEVGHESIESLIEGDGPDTEFTNYAYFDLATEDGPLGSMVFGLYGKVAPKTVLNFVEICRGKEGMQGETATKGKEALCYMGSPLHRIIPKFMAQGGDITMGDGTGGASIFGETFEDENFTLKHDAAGLLSMANAGPNTNGSQFFILFEPQKHLNGKHTVFGKALEGESMRTLRLLESLGSPSGETKKAVFVKACGELLPDELDDFLDDMTVTAERHGLNLEDHLKDLQSPESAEMEAMTGGDGMPGGMPSEAEVDAQLRAMGLGMPETPTQEELSAQLRDMGVDVTDMFAEGLADMEGRDKEDRPEDAKK